MNRFEGFYILGKTIKLFYFRYVKFVEILGLLLLLLLLLLLDHRVLFHVGI